MGNLWARFRHRDVRIILLGLDSAGKTTILYRLKLDDLVTTIPTIGFNVENIQYKDLHLTAWDIGSRDKIRPLFRHYYKGADAVVFVIDSHDPERLDELNYDVIKPAVNAEELTNAVFLFLANKMDLPDTMTTEEIADKLGLRFLKHPWGILPVSAVSGEGLQAALEWLAIRLGSSQVKARNFTAQPKPKSISIQQCRTGSSLSSASSTATAKTDNSKPNSKAPSSSQKPVIFVNSKLYMDTRAAPSYSSGSIGNASAMSISTPGSGSNYNAYVPRRTPGSVMNSFSSYSIAQSMRDDISRRKFSSISRSDIRKLSCASLNDSAGGRKLSSASLLDSPSQRKMSSVSLMDSPYRRKNSTSFVIDPPAYRKFSSTSLMDAAYSRKLSAASLGDPRLTDTPSIRKLSAASLNDPRLMATGAPRKLSATSLGDSQDENEKPKMSYLSAAPNVVATPPTAKRKSEDLSLAGFGSFTPIMADYIHSSRKDSDTSADSLNIVSPSEHIQPHLRPLGLEKSPALSNSGNYSNYTNAGNYNNYTNVASTIDAMKEEHYEEILRLLPERYTKLYMQRGSLSAIAGNPQLADAQNLLSAQEEASNDTSMVVPNPSSNKKKKKTVRQSSHDSDSSSSSSNGKRKNLDLFCTPTRKSHSQNHSRNRSKDRSSAIVSSSGRGAYCSRAYSAIKCLFFRPTKQEMQQETNSISSSDDENENVVNVDNVDNADIENGNDVQENERKISVGEIQLSIRVDVTSADDDPIHDSNDNKVEENLNETTA